MNEREDSGAFKALPQEVKDAVLAAKKADPKVKSEKLASQFGLNKSTINTILRNGRGDLIGAKGFTPQQEQELLSLWRKSNVSVKGFCQLTGLSKYRVESFLLKMGAIDYTLTPEKEAQVLRIKADNPSMKHREIADKVGLKKDVVADIVAKHGLQAPKYRQGQWVRIKKVTEEVRSRVMSSWVSQEQTPVSLISEKVGVGETTVRRILEQHGVTLDKKAITPEIEEKIVSIRQNAPSTQLDEIAKHVGLHVFSVKKVLQKRGALLTPVQRQANAEAGREALYREGLPALKQKLRDIVLKHEGVVFGDYSSSKDKLKFICKKGHEFHNHPNGIFNGNWCPRCANRVSDGELEVKTFIESIYSGELIGSSRKEIHPMEIDIYATGRLAVEYNGLFWHSAYFPGNNGRHYKKATACRKKGISLFAIFEDEWKNKQPLVKSMIAQRLGVSTAQRLDARKLDYRSVPTKDAFAFFEEHHLAGGTNASEAVGLYKENQLVACASFRNNFNGEYELARLATHRDFLVRGGAGKLLSKVDRPLVSFSDNRVGSGGVYQKLGFKLVAENNSSYWYTDGQVRIWRWKCRKVNHPDYAHLTEVEQCLAGVQSMKIFGDNRPLYKIEDYGHRKWFLDKPLTSD